MKSSIADANSDHYRLEFVSPSKLKLNPANPRKNDAAVEAVAKSMQAHGFKRPLIANQEGVICAGNISLKAAKKIKDRASRGHHQSNEVEKALRVEKARNLVIFG
jgi:ParB-like chromosome segregation protein Spo0J